MTRMHGLTGMTIVAAFVAAPLLATSSLAQSMGTSTGTHATGTSTANSPAGSGSYTSSTANNSAATGSMATGSNASANANSTYTTADDHLRGSKIIGASVYNDQNQKIGSVDDILFDMNKQPTDTVISVGGFLGMGSKLVEIPYAKLQINNDKVMMPGATKDALNSMPTYHYDTNSHG